ncbi:hypothetical protein ABVK25_002710 [Lepraria finkii]|uniref:Uncharacterized protein n=1 Tax=Lepraria finkii TaxID=1340010 RepID=A0ABR4BJG3_9LECA
MSDWYSETADESRGLTSRLLNCRIAVPSVNEGIDQVRRLRFCSPCGIDGSPLLRNLRRITPLGRHRRTKSMTSSIKPFEIFHAERAYITSDIPMKAASISVGNVMFLVGVALDDPCVHLSQRSMASPDFRLETAFILWLGS